jgi:hypothetical protein
VKSKASLTAPIEIPEAIVAHFASAIAEAPAEVNSARKTVNTAPLTGAAYTAFDLGNGWYKIKNVLMFSEVPKGQKDAPEDVKRERMQQMVNLAQAKWEKERYAAPVHKGHHKLLEFSDPEFLGFVLPTAVGRHVLDGKMQDVVYGEVTLKESAFARILKGELPYLSPEVDWANWKFSSLSFLDSKPPHFEFPLVTIGNVVKDGSAKFEVRLTSNGGKFMAVSEQGLSENNDRKKEYKEKEGVEPKEDTAKKGVGGEAEVEAEAESGGSRLRKLEMGYTEMDKAMASIHFKMGLPYKGAMMEADKFVKPASSAPVEDQVKGDVVSKVSATQIEPKMSNTFASDPEARAAFAAQEMRTKALEDKLAKRDAEEALKARVDAAFSDLKGYPITDTVKADVAHFAAQSDESLKKYVAAIKAQTPQNPPKNLAAYEALGITKPVGAVMSSDSDIAEFAKQSPEKGAAAQRWATAFEVWKASPFSKRSSLRDNRKVWVEEQMRIDPTGKTADSLTGGTI